MPEDAKASKYPNVKKSDPEFRQIEKVRDQDRDLHVARSQEAGLSREEAEEHAEEHLRQRNDANE